MEQQITVTNQVETAQAIHSADMLAKLIATFKRFPQFSNNNPLTLSQFIRIFGINRREVHIQHWMMPIATIGSRFRQIQSSFFEINLVKQIACFHPIFGMRRNELSFELKLDDRDSLMHLTDQVDALIVVDHIVIPQLRLELAAGVTCIGFHSETRQWEHIDAVSVLDGIQIRIPQSDADNASHTSFVAGSGPHPQYIVISPLYIHIMVLGYSFHNELRTGATVVNIPYNMQAIHH